MPTKQPGGSTWNHEADKDLLLTIIEMGTLKSIMWPDISAKMQAKGYTFSKEACRQHFQKIRKEASNGGDKPARATPKSNKPAAPKSTPQKAAMYQNGSFGNGSGYGEDDDEEDMSQLAKRKKVKSEDENGQSAPLFKTERFDSTGHAVPFDLINDDLYEAKIDYPQYA